MDTPEKTNDDIKRPGNGTNAADGAVAPPADGGAGGGAVVPPPADGGAGGGAVVPPPADGGAGGGAVAPPAGGGAGGGAVAPPADGGAVVPPPGNRVPTLNVNAAAPSTVLQTKVSASELKPPPSMTIGKKLALWVLSILAGSILLLVLYLWRMDVTTGDDIRRNYGKDLNRDDVSLYMGQRIQRFSSDLVKAKEDPSFVALRNDIADDKALSETLGSLPGVNDEQHAQLTQCISLISNKASNASERPAKLQPCIDVLEEIRTQGMSAATAALSFQMASEASTKLFEQRQSLHEFWLKAAQLILLNLLLPVLTAVIGYTFGSNQAQQSSASDK